MIQDYETAFYLQDNDKQTKDQHAAKQNKAAVTKTAECLSSLPKKGIKTQVNNTNSH